MVGKGLNVSVVFQINICTVLTAFMVNVRQVAYLPKPINKNGFMGFRHMFIIKNKCFIYCKTNDGCIVGGVHLDI